MENASPVESADADIRGRQCNPRSESKGRRFGANSLCERRLRASPISVPIHHTEDENSRL